MTMFCVSPPMIRELHAVAELGDEDQRQQDAEHRARAAEDVDAAENDGGDDVEQRALGGVGARGAEEADVDDPGDPGHQPGDGEDRHAGARDRDAGEAGRLAVRADREEVAAEARRVEQNARGRRRQ